MAEARIIFVWFYLAYRVKRNGEANGQVVSVSARRRRAHIERIGRRSRSCFGATALPQAAAARNMVSFSPSVGRAPSLSARVTANFFWSVGRGGDQFSGRCPKSGRGWFGYAAVRRATDRTLCRRRRSLPKHSQSPFPSWREFAAIIRSRACARSTAPPWIRRRLQHGTTANLRASSGRGPTVARI